MADPTPDSKTPALAAFGLAILGLVIAAVQGSVLHGSITGGIIAFCGVIPACFGMWKGIQQETQTTLALSVASVLVTLGVAAALIVLRVVSFGVHHV
ncbi:MAG TPA: hypothetical protein VGG28_02210 [Kofleriaceae bacterium]|jgi:hypothetical protein